MNIFIIIGLFLLVVTFLFIKFYAKNVTHVETKELEVIKMKMKIAPLEKNESFSFGKTEAEKQNSFNSNSSSQTKNKSPVFLTFNSPKVMTSKYLNFVGFSKKNGSSIYSLIGDNVSILKGTGYSEILNFKLDMVESQSNSGFRKTL